MFDEALGAAAYICLDWGHKTKIGFVVMSSLLLIIILCPFYDNILIYCIKKNMLHNNLGHRDATNLHLMQCLEQ